MLLDRLFGAEVHELPGGADALAFAQERANELRRAGRRPYVVGSGGSSPIGCLGYASCANEILEQEESLGFAFTCIVVPNGSSGTHAGLAAGMAAAANDASRVRSYAVLAPAEQTQRHTHALAVETLTLINPAAAIPSGAVQVDGSQLGEGYGMPTEAMFDAVLLMARAEGMLLDPVYGGKAFGGLLQAVRQGMFAAGANILFVMTGGTPSLFAYRSAFDQKI